MRNSDGGGATLSPGQSRFAAEHDARVGMLAADHQGEVFLYHDDAWATYRWLVDDAGRAVDSTTFRKSPRPRAEKPLRAWPA